MRTKNGFTLFELLVAISIIGILTALASVSFSAAQKRGRDARRVEDMRSIQTAAEQYYSISGNLYPDAYVPGSSQWAAGGQTVLDVFPKDPLNQPTNEYDCGSSNTASFCCCAHLEIAGTGNALNPSCNFGAGTRSYYCVKNQQ